MTVATSTQHPAVSGDTEWGYRTIPHPPKALNTKPSRRFYFVLMMPAIIVLAAITIYPFLWLIYMSLFRISNSPRTPDRWVGLDNYIRLIYDDKYIESWLRLLEYSATCLTIEITLGVFIAVIINNSRFEKLWVTIFLMPMMVSPVVAGLLYYYLYNGTFGWYHWLFESLGLLGETSILASAETAMIGIVLVDIWQWTPLIILITLAGLKRVPQDQQEASLVDGSSRFQNFWSVTLPNIYPFLLIAILLRFMDNFRFIDAILALTGGGPADATKLLPVYLYDVSFSFFRLGRGAAIAFTLLLVTIILGMILVKLLDDPAKKKGMASND